MFIHGHQRTQASRADALDHQGIARTVARDHLVRCQLLDLGLGHALGTQLGFRFFARLAEHQCLALGQAVGVQPLMVVGHWVETDHWNDEVRRDQLRALVQQLVIGVLAIATDAAPDDRAGVMVNRGAVLAHALAVGLHVQLLQMLGDVAQVMIIRQDRMALRAPEIAVPDAEQGQQYRHVLLEWCVLEVLVHGVGTGQQLLEVGHADGQGDRQADGRPQGVTAAYPVPHREDVFFTNAEGDSGGVVARYRDEVTVKLCFRATLGQVPAACCLGVFQGFQGAEGFRGNNEQRCFGAQLGRQFVEFAAIDVRQVVATYAFLGVGQQGFGDQFGAQEGAADADIDHIGDGLFGVTAPQAIMNTPDQFGDLVQDLVHLGHHVDAIHVQLVADWAAQGRVQRRTAFGGIEDFAGEQRLDRRLQADFACKLDQQVTRLAGDQVFRVVEEQATTAQGKLVETLGVGIECIAHAEILHAFAVLLQRLPGGQSGNVVRSAVIRHRYWFP
ncbi:hypothetical protein D3C76_631880 [compost metagenome]